MTAAAFVSFVLAVLETFPARTPLAVDSEVLELLRGIYASPDMLEWLECWLSKEPTISNGVEAVKQLPEDADTVSGGNIGHLITLLSILMELYQKHAKAVQ